MSNAPGTLIVESVTDINVDIAASALDEGAAPTIGRLPALLRHRATRRLLWSLVTLVGVSILVFIVLRVVPGNQIDAAFGTEGGALTPAQHAALAHYYGIDRSPLAQYFSWMGSVLTGNLGLALNTHISVTSMTRASLPVSIELAILATLLGTLAGVLLGAVSASRPNGVRDTLGQATGLLGLSVPSFVLATAIVTVVASKFNYFPNGGEYKAPWQNLSVNLQQMLFPALVLGFAVAAPVMRTTRSAMIEVASRDFVRTARGKGVSPSGVLFRHVLGNALIPIVTIVGIQFGYLLGGAVIVEQIFALPGIGRQVFTAIEQREYAVVQSTVLVIAAAFVLVNFLTDLLYRRIDPRVREL
jgi:peptide/nickel transport system permease protein